MKNFYITLFLSLFVAGKAVSQVPGYRGKRASIGYSHIFSGSSFALNVMENGFSWYHEYTDKDAEVNILTNLNHQFHFDYLVTRGTAIGGYLSFWRKNQSSMPIEERVYSPYYSSHNFGSFSSAAILEEGVNEHGEYRDYLYEGSGKLSGQGLGIYFKFFGKKPLAPLGDYFQMTFLINRATSYRQILTNSDEEGGKTYQKLSTKSSYAPAFIISWGKQWMVFDRLLINGALETGLGFPIKEHDESLNYDTDYENGAYYYAGESYTKQERLDINARYGLQFNYLLQFRLGISYMAF